MKRRHAWILLLLIGVHLCLMVAGCKDRGQAKPRIAVIPKGTAFTFWQSVYAGAKAAGEEFGFQIYFNGPERETDRERQIQIVEDFAVQKVDGIVLAPLDRKALVPSVLKLAQLKIPCVIIDSDIETDRYITFAATDNYQGGVLAARRMGEILKGRGRIVVLKYAQGSGSTTDRENGFIETIQKEFPGIQIVDTKYALDTVETALQATEDLLTKNRDLQGLFAPNISSSVGALRALLSQKRTEVKMVGFDAEKALVEAVGAGQIDALVVQNPYRMGYEGVKAVADTLKGKVAPRRIDTGVKVITQANINDPEVKALLKSQ
jgi:ribose transport system substrate-binding protein